MGPDIPFLSDRAGAGNRNHYLITCCPRLARHMSLPLVKIDACESRVVSHKVCDVTEITLLTNRTVSECSEHKGEHTLEAPQQLG